MSHEYENELTREQIAATIAHEIKNPLALIRATLQYVELGDTQQIYKQKYDLIYREIDRLSELVASYTEDSGYRRLYLRKFKVAALFKELGEIFNETVKNRGIKLNVSGIDPYLEVKGDYNKTKQVIINLFTNSIEALEGVPEGEITVNAFRKGKNIVITVKDNGCGIKETDINSVGNLFFTTKEKGHGLGLSISNEIIKMHNGSLSICGEEGKGTVVTITVPAFNAYPVRL